MWTILPDNINIEGGKLMSMNISGSYNPYKTDYMEHLKEKQSLDRAEKAREAAKESSGVKASEKTPVPQDEYISSEKSGAKPTGLYRVGQDENGNPKVFFDDPGKAKNAEGKEQPKVNEGGPKEDKGDRQPEVNGGNPGNPSEKCLANTDKVDREIKQLKEKMRKLQQQIASASEDEAKVKELEQKLAQVEQELSRKDNDAYRRSHTSFTDMK